MQNSSWQNMQKFFFNSQILKKKRKEKKLLAFILVSYSISNFQTPVNSQKYKRM